MNLICLNTDFTFRVLIEKIVPTSFNIKYVNLSEDNNFSFSSKDLYIISPIPIKSPNPQFLNNLKKHDLPIITFQELDDLYGFKNLIKLDLSISKKNFSEILNYVKIYNNGEKTRKSPLVTHVDSDITRGYIHTINNKLFIPLSTLSSIGKFLNGETSNKNIEDILHYKDLALRSLDEIKDYSNTYRKLILPSEEFSNNTSFNMKDLVIESINLSMYKANKAKVDITLNPSTSKEEKYLFTGNEIVYLQFFMSMTIFFLNIKKANKESKFKEIVFQLTKKKDLEELTISCIFHKNSEIEIQKITEDPNFKQIFISYTELLFNAPNLSFKILRSKLGIHICLYHKGK